MTNLTPEIIESGTLNTPYYIDKSFSTDDGVNVAAICDVNGFHVFDCFESDAEEIIKRINCYEQQAETIERLRAKPKLYRHIKTGGLYEFISDAEMENNLQDVVVYQSVEHKTVWVRPSTEFYDGRFEEVNKLEAGEV